MLRSFGEPSWNVGVPKNLKASLRGHTSFLLCPCASNDCDARLVENVGSGKLSIWLAAGTLVGLVAWHAVFIHDHCYASRWPDEQF
jgi:hypothetical protein